MSPEEAAAFVESLATMLEKKRVRYIVLPMDVARALVAGVRQPPEAPAADCSGSDEPPPQTPQT